MRQVMGLLILTQEEFDEEVKKSKLNDFIKYKDGDKFFIHRTDTEINILNEKFWGKDKGGLYYKARDGEGKIHKRRGLWV